MIEQLKTIREGIEKAHIIGGQDGIDKALTALTQLEAMVGEQEPVAWYVEEHSDILDLEWNRLKPTYPGNWKPLYEYPPAHQYEAGDVASAAAQGFRDGVASVTQQEPVAWQRRMKPVWGDRDYLWSPWEECSEGTAEDCWKTPLLHEWAYEARALYTAVPVDQRPRAKEIGEADLDPDEGDPVTLWAEIWRLREAVKGPDGYATWQDAATAERIRRVRAESKHAAPVAQQPQARPDFTDEWTGYLKNGETPFERFLRERKDLTALTKLYQRALEENERLKAQQPQAEAVPTLYVSLGQLENLKPDPEGTAGTYLPVRKTPRGKFTHPLFAAPQQAEAVPPDVVRDAERWLWMWNHAQNVSFSYSSRPYEITTVTKLHCGSLKDTVDAAIAQQKGSV